MRRAVMGGLLVSCLAACGSPSPAGHEGGAEADDESFLTGAGPAPASEVAGAVDPSHVSTGPLSTHWDALMVRQLSTAKGREFRLKEFHRGERFSLSVVGIAGRMPSLGDRKRTEVLIVVEGERGVVSMGDQRYRVSAGSVAVFPPGSRGEIQAPREEPLIGLLITTDAPSPAGTKPFLASFERLWSDESFATNQDTSSELLRIPGVLSLRAYTIYGFLPVHYHPRHEEIVFLLQGDGSFGLGNSGNLVKGGSLLLVPPGAPHYFQNREVQGTRCLMLHGADLGPKDSVLIEGHPDPVDMGDLNYPGAPPANGASGPGVAGTGDSR